MRIVFMGTPDFAVETLAAINDAGHEIALVVTQPDKPKGRSGKLQMSDVKQYAIDHGLKVFQPEKIKNAESVAELSKYAPELIVVAAFGQILSKDILEMPKYGCINVHASLLPRLRGASPIQTSILEGDSESGVTIQQMGEGLDTGDILSQRSIPIDSTDTGGSLFDKLAKLGAELAVDTIEDIGNGRINPVPQDDSKASYAKKIDKQMGCIDWGNSAEAIARQVRALDPWPSAYTKMGGKLLKVWKAEALTGEVNVAEDKGSKVKHGEITDITEDSITVKCGVGSLRLNEVQIEGKKRMTVHDFLLGHRPDVSTILGE
ncbi:MAG: methionyl-tRNA formyltransferase [Lachnospiraceae bacterium]|nr:methionyl-tRNA formyltransferase [Lachnospiraceae bacterium]